MNGGRGEGGRGGRGDVTLEGMATLTVIQTMFLHTNWNTAHHQNKMLIYSRPDNHITVQGKGSLELQC